MGMILKGEVSIGGQRLQSIVSKNVVINDYVCGGDSFKFKRLKWGRPLNVESRGLGQGFLPVQLFLNLWVHHGRGPRCRRCQGGGGQEELVEGREPLLDWMSWSWSRGAITPVRGEESTPPLTRLDGVEGGKQGVPERPNLLRRRTSLRYSKRLRKNRSIREFRLLSYVCICAKFFFPTGFFSIFCTAWYMCSFSILGCCRISVVEYAVRAARRVCLFR